MPVMRHVHSPEYILGATGGCLGRFDLSHSWTPRDRYRSIMYIIAHCMCTLQGQLSGFEKAYSGSLLIGMILEKVWREQKTCTGTLSRSLGF